MDTPCAGVSQESCQGQLQLGEGRVVESSQPRAGRDRSRVRVRVVGDCAFGWAEAANSWGATVEVLVHINVDNHTVRNSFALPKYYWRDTAIQLCGRSAFDGVYFTTVLDSEQATMSGNLFNLWQPMVAIIALPSNLSRTQIGKFLAYFDRQRYKPYQHTLHYKAMCEVTHSCWLFLHLTRRADISLAKKIMTYACYAPTLQTALDNTVGEA